MKHAHAHCAHTHVSYCHQCELAYCQDCGREWHPVRRNAWPGETTYTYGGYKAMTNAECPVQMSGPHRHEGG